ncbi:MAG: Crp/Fnr family transcriptional regulator [Eubacteriales bacterium]|jgi:CRP-like cAMP-binding protein|nr:Crp/Fnr family transcriptional regulator [Eubacteriales bacterium]
MVINFLKNSPLFRGIDDIESCLSCGSSFKKVYAKDEVLFYEDDVPKTLCILVSGSVAVCKDFASGKRNILTIFDTPGEIFGEVYVFLQGKTYDHYTVAVNKAEVLHIPKSFFYHTCSRCCTNHETLIKNMLSILAEKAYFLNQKLRIISGSNLREKIVKMLVSDPNRSNYTSLSMSRDEMADYLGVARPSLSRELMKMQNEGIIKVQGKNIIICDFEKIEEYL